MANFITSIGLGSGGGGGGSGTDPEAVHSIIFQGVEYSATANQIILPTLIIPTNTSDLTNDSGFLDSTDIAPVAISGSFNDLIDKPDLSPLATAIQNANSIGGGQSVFSAKSGTNLVFKTIMAGDNISLDADTTPGAIIISSTGGGGGGSGEANTTSNLGTGVGLAAPKSGVNLPFRSLLSSAGLVWSSSDNEVTLSLDATLVAIAALNFSADTFMYADGPDSFQVASITPYARSLLDDANAPTARATLGSTTVGDSVFVATTTTIARAAIGISDKVPAYRQNGTILNIAVNNDGTINVFNQAGSIYTIEVVAA